MNESIYFQIQTLGDFSVTYGEKNLTDAFENSQKLLELFIYFITYRNEMILSEKIIDEIWPESDFSDPKRTLRALIFRLRKILCVDDAIQGSSIITYSNGCYKFNAREYCEVDIDAFEATYKQANELYLKNKIESIEKYKIVIQMYHGGYLKRIALYDWLTPIKSRYHHMFLSSCGRKLDFLADENRNQEIIILSEEIMRHDIYSEHMHMHYVESLSKLGELKQAKSHVAYIQKIFDREIGLQSRDFVSKMNDLIVQNATSIPANLDLKSGINPILHESKGPILCDNKFFELYQKIEVQRSERLCKNLYWGTITICECETASKEEVKVLDPMEMLRVILVSNLRKGDVISQSKDRQFSISLSTDNLKHAEKAIARIQKKFGIACAASHITIKTELYQYPVTVIADK